MASQQDVRRIALSLPGVTEAKGRFAFGFRTKGKHKGFAWVWLERVAPRKPRVPNPGVLAVRVRGELEKSALLGGDPDRFFTEPHYDGFPAVLVRLPRVTKGQLGKLLLEGWRCLAPKPIVAELEAARRGRKGRGRPPSGKDLLARLRAICMALPEADERISHGEPAWFAGKGKVFAMLDAHHHGSAHLSVWLPAGLGAQEALIESDPARFFRPPYVGPRGWVGVVLDTRPDWKQVAWLVEQAYRHVAHPCLVARLPRS